MLTSSQQFAFLLIIRAKMHIIDQSGLLKNRTYLYTSSSIFCSTKKVKEKKLEEIEVMILLLHLS